MVFKLTDKRLTMNVSKINVLNVNKTGVSLFRGDTPVSENDKKDNSKTTNATKFLYGAGIVSAGILAAALAARAGLFSKKAASAVNNSQTPVKKRVPSPEIIVEEKVIPLDPPREERLKAREVVQENLQYFIDYSKFGNAKTEGQKAAFFTNCMNRINNMSYEEQFDEFQGFLKFIKTLEPESVKNKILFTLGRFKRDNNERFAKEALDFAKENPAYKNTILSNLVAYETDGNFARELAGTWFHKTDNLAKRYDKHVDDLIKIRKLLTETGLKSDERTRLKNRQDWINIGYHSPNTYMLGFQYSERAPEIRKAAFEYDIMHGLSKDEAASLIDQLKAADTSITHKTIEELSENLQTHGVPKDRAASLINQLNDETAQLRQKEIEYLQGFSTDDVSKEKQEELRGLLEKLYSDDALPASYIERAGYGISKDEAKLMVRQLNSQITVSETQKTYGMTLDEMIEKINKAVI